MLESIFLKRLWIFATKFTIWKTFRFEVGDSESIPFEDEKFDVVLNVESSHCYGDMDQFMSEVTRVLKPGGHFLWCDLRPGNSREKTNTHFANSGSAINKQKRNHRQYNCGP